MLSSVLATFDESKETQVRLVLHELKQDKNINIKKIVFGQLFDKMTASIFFQEKDLQSVFDKLLANEITIYPYDDEYKERIRDTYEKLSRDTTYSKDKLRAFKIRIEEYKTNNPGRKDEPQKDAAKGTGSVNKNQQAALAAKILKKDSEANNKFEFNLHTEGGKTKLTGLAKMCKEGDYLGIRNIINKNPVLNQEAKEKFIPAVKNCIKINLDKGLESRYYVDEAIHKLKTIICDKDIKSIVTDDLVSIAGNAVITLCADQDPEELIKVANLPNIGEKINILAVVKLGELIYENERSGIINEELLNEATSQLNTRFVTMAYDVMETVISETNKTRFQKLMKAIDDAKMGKA
jgi:hypothetical protein